MINNNVSIFKINKEEEGQRIDNFLFCIYKKIPKSHIYKIIRSGEVRVNKKRIDVNYKLLFCDIVRIPPIYTVKDILYKYFCVHSLKKNNKLFYDVLYEDRYLLIINKPYGIAVHGGSGISIGLIERLRSIYIKEKYLELVHRLDRDTSGILVLSKKKMALKILHEQIRSRKVIKKYFVLVYGNWLDSWGNKCVVKQPLHKYVLSNGERRVCVKSGGLFSHSIFKLIGRWNNYLLIQAELKTGRTHQIRVHLQYLNLCVVGDEKYGNIEFNNPIEVNRMFLHAFYLKFKHPVLKKYIEIYSKFPKEFLIFINKLNNMI